MEALADAIQKPELRRSRNPLQARGSDVASPLERSGSEAGSAQCIQRDRQLPDVTERVRQRNTPHQQQRLRTVVAGAPVISSSRPTRCFTLAEGKGCLSLGVTAGIARGEIVFGVATSLRPLRTYVDARG